MEKIDCPPSERRGTLLMLGSGKLFATTSLLLSYAHTSHGINGWVASSYRGIIGLAVVFAMQSRTGKLSLGHIFTRRLLFTRGLIGGLTIPVYYFCIMELGAGRAGIIAGVWPLFGALFAAALLKEQLYRSYFFYIGLTIIGIVAVFAGDGIGETRLGFDLLALSGAAAGGLCVVLIRHLRHTETTSNIFAAQCIFTVIIATTFARSDLIITDKVALTITLIAAFTVVSAQLCLTEAFRQINVAKGSALQMLTPVVTTLFSALLLGESFSLYELLGGAAVLYGSYRIAIHKAIFKKS
ncbi:DMT family transporter [Coraliomargarita sp. W4R53]